MIFYKNPLTNPKNCDIIIMQGRNPERVTILADGVD
uniref:Uncharacterized protein n=1 Tax=Siphoviridae sp. ctTDf8 TaxID=2825517 RepID=A0A8S5UJ24_9CAUD|nr:MAG TPA: hypothetical protein [Siphoviridae sp. ctTDf8]